MSKEYIEREALKSEICDTTWYHTTTHGSVVIGAENENEALYIGKDVYDAIDRVPTADVVEVRHGEWVHNEEYEDWAEMWVCSLCNGNAPTNGDYRHNLLSHYCPNCGAKMDGKGEGE